MQKRSLQQWIIEGKKNCQSLIFYQNNVLDISQFMLEHPGGVKAIKNYIYKDITNIIFDVFPHHQDNTLNKLFKFKIGQIPKNQAVRPKNKNQRNGEKKKRVCFNNQNRDNIKQQSISKIISKTKQSTPINTSKKSSNTSKSKKKQYLTSIKIITGPNNTNNNIASTIHHYHHSNNDHHHHHHSNNDHHHHHHNNNNDHHNNHHHNNHHSNDHNEKRRQKQKQDYNNSKTLIIKSRSKNLYQSITQDDLCSNMNNQLDEEKPNFKVPVLMVKIMNKQYAM